MRRLRFVRLLLWLVAAPLLLRAAGSFEGTWTGRISGPQSETALGLAFVPAPDGLLVSVDFPEMFLHSVNFGPAEIRDETFTLAPLGLSVSLQGDRLSGTFGPAALPVELHRGGTFTPPPPPPAPPSAPAPLWSRSVGSPVWATPAVAGDTVFVAAIDGSLHALQTGDGAELWSWTGPHPLYGEPLVTADAVYLVDERCDLVCVDRARGTLRWRVPLHDATLAGAPAPSNETFNHRATKPVLDERGILYVGSTDGGLYAVRADRARILWRHDLKARVYAPVAVRGNDLVVACFDGSVVTLNRRTRRESSRVKLGGALASAPVIAGDRVILGCRDYMLYALTPRGDTAWRRSFWFSWVESTPRLADGTLYIGGSDFRRISALDAQSGAARWATDVLGLSWGTPVVTADTVFAATAGQHLAGTVIQHRGGIAALDRATGEWIWRFAAPVTDGAEFSGYTNSLAIAGDRLVAAGVDGVVLALPLR